MDSISPGQDTPSPLLVPELLENIFSFLPPPLLRRSLVRVSRLWYSVAIRFISYEGCWYNKISGPELNLLMDQLPRLSALKIKMVPDSPTPSARDQSDAALSIALTPSPEEILISLDSHRSSSSSNTSGRNDHNNNISSQPQWDLFQGRIRSLAEPGAPTPLEHEMDSKERRPSLRRLRSLCLSGVTDFEAMLYPLLPNLEFLTDLRIEGIIDYHQARFISLLEILSAAPQLESISIAYAGTSINMNVAVLWENLYSPQASEDDNSNDDKDENMDEKTSISATTDNAMADTSTASTMRSFPRLQHLILNKVWVPKRDLEIMLTHTPSLRSLKVVQCRHNPSQIFNSLQLEFVTMTRPGKNHQREQLFVLSPFRRDRFYESVIRHCPNLDIIQLSFSDEDAPTPETDVDFLLRLPHRTGLSFSTSSFGLGPTYASTLLQCCQSRGLFLTTLEITSVPATRRPSPGMNEVLHQYLCQAPQLLHLRAKQFWFWVPLLDPGMNDPDSRPPSNLPWMYVPRRDDDTSVWACKDLQTLHLCLETSGSRNIEASPDTMRLVFGYLSVVCPKLRDLSLQFQDPLPFRIEEGLSLLMRLQDLEVLELITRATVVLDLPLQQHEGSNSSSSGERRKSSSSPSSSKVSSGLRRSDLDWIHPLFSTLSSPCLTLDRVEREHWIQKRKIEAMNEIRSRERNNDDNNSSSSLSTAQAKRSICPWRTIPREKLTLQDLRDMRLLISVVLILEDQLQDILSQQRQSEPTKVSEAFSVPMTTFPVPSLVLNPCWPRLHTWRVTSLQGTTKSWVIPWLRELRPEIDIQATEQIQIKETFMY
ncbi:hypothetical protein BGZ83_003776 [Gryganskiella cystojenkinii]|nr:hypothetical protein BGZ83_003776 [Gryganskiella cystojenkinii]